MEGLGASPDAVLGFLARSAPPEGGALRFFMSLCCAAIAWRRGEGAGREEGAAAAQAPIAGGWGALGGERQAAPGAIGERPGAQRAPVSGSARGCAARSGACLAAAASAGRAAPRAQRAQCAAPLTPGSNQSRPRAPSPPVAPPTLAPPSIAPSPSPIAAAPDPPLRGRGIESPPTDSPRPAGLAPREPGLSRAGAGRRPPGRSSHEAAHGGGGSRWKGAPIARALRSGVADTPARGRIAGDQDGL